MTDLEHKLLTGMAGENRLNPDEQRRYLGTFAERVLLTAPFDLATSQNFQGKFPDILKELKKDHQPLILKLSDGLSNKDQMTYLKLTSQADIPATIVQEEGAISPFALVLHSDQAVQRTETDAAILYPDLLEQKRTKKASFWGRLFGGH